MSREFNRTEERLDRDIVRVADSDSEQLRSLREYLESPIKAKESKGKPHLHSGALRKYADLDSVPEHPFKRQLRELREARER